MAETMTDEDRRAELWFGILHSAHNQLQASARCSIVNGDITMAEAAKQLGMSQERVQQYLRGRRPMSLRTMHNMARVFGYRMWVTIDRIPKSQTR